MSRYAVTGATGFLGGALARALQAAGHEVTAFGRDAARCAALEREGMRVALLDLAEGDIAAQLSDGVDAIVHCAALSTTWGARAAFHAANVRATARLVEAAVARGCGHFVFVSSPSVYFRPCDQFGLHEDAALPAPINLYARSKNDGERIVRAERRLPTTIIRPRGLYGRGDSALLPRLLTACGRGPLPLLRGGRAVTDLTHVDDAVAAIEAVLAAGPGDGSRTFNVSGGEALAIRHIIAEAAARTGLTPRWRRLPWPPFLAAVIVGEAAHRLAGSVRGPAVTRYSAGILAFSQTLDISAIAAATRWRPRIAFADGLERTFG